MVACLISLTREICSIQTENTLQKIFGGTRLYFGIIVEAWNNTALSDIWDISLLFGLLDFPLSFITDILLLPYDSILNFIEIWKDFYN